LFPRSSTGNPSRSLSTHPNTTTCRSITSIQCSIQCHKTSFSNLSYTVISLPSLTIEPRRTRSRKTHKGREPVKIGKSTKGTILVHGNFGLRIVKRSCRMSAKQLETADNVLRKALKDFKGVRIYYRYACGRAVCKKGNEVWFSPRFRLISGAYGER